MSCFRKTVFTAKVSYLAILVIRKRVTMTRCMVMQPFGQTYVQSVESMDEKGNCGRGR